MNFMISLLGWFLWNWAEFSITKEEGDESVDVNKRISLLQYTKTHYETWIGSFACIFLLLWIGYRNLSIDPLAPLFGIEAKLGWNDLYLVGSGAAWDAFIFGFKKVKKFFEKK